MTLLDELCGLKALRIRPEDSVEKAAFQVASTKDRAAHVEAVAIGVRWARQPGNTSAAQYLAWLLVYGAVHPLQVLQAIVYTGDASIVKICGTSHFQTDSVQHLKLPETVGATPSYTVQSPGPSPGRSSVMVDFLAVETASEPEKKQDGSVAAKKGEQAWSQELAKKSEERKLDEFRRRVRAIIMGSMSAEEVAHKLLSITPKRLGVEVVDVLVHACAEEKAYNRLYAMVAYRLCRQAAHWADALEKAFADVFAKAAEDLDVNQLNIVGALFGQLLQLGAVDWVRIFSSVSLDPELSTPSNRILLQALMRELGQEMGRARVEERLTEPKTMTGISSAVFTGDFAAQFWHVTGFETLARHVQVYDDEDDDVDDGSGSDSSSGPA